uniref:DWNN domain-containing protein n=1 Tax=Amphora coffeiformis TaxID=265554 RepID=A0A7S3P8Z4_9STRA
MSASILYKFRSSTTFEALPLPGSAARLFDVKKAIVLAKKLDQAGSMEFDLSVRDATTNEEYADENMLLPRGTRLIVQRLPAARGHGFLSRMARNPYGGGAPVTASHAAAPSNFYNIDSRAHAEDDEFVSSTAAPVHDDEKELAALRAATDAGRGDLRLHVSGAGGGGGFRPPTGGAGRGAGGNNSNSNFVPRQRPNADPELREQEKQPKKRATGIPRTFLNLSAPPATDGMGDGETANVPLLQPNTIGFEELVNRGGGQSENASSSNRLEYALKITAQTVPEYLQCAICHNVVKDAMILPWDAEGRTTCESCIRDALTQNGFRCPLTGQEGVSPDDLLPNLALRKAAVQFVKGVMEKMEEITKQRVDDDEDVDFTQGDSKAALLEGDSGDKGVIISKKTTLTGRKKQEEEDPFAGEDDFGGDVFAVDVEEKPEVAEEVTPKAKQEETVKEEVEVKKEESPVEQKQNQNVEKPTTAKPDLESPKNVAPERSSSPANSRGGREPTSSRRDRRRGPPVGYSMGPAGGAALGPREDSYSPRNDSRGGDGRDRDFGGGRGRSRAYGRGDREDNGKDSSSRHHDDAGESNSITSDRDRDRDRNSDRDRFSDRERGSKRPRSGSDYDDPPPEDDRYNSRRNTNDDRSYGRYDDRRGGGDYRSQGYQGRGGGGRGYGGRFDDRGGYRGRGGGRRGGGYRGRGRY